MDRTLYLNENRGIAVMRDGPSIWIKEDGRAGRRIPARLIGRVVVIGNLKMESGVITLFTENNVPVTFMDRRGEKVAVTIPYNDHLPRHYEEQKVFLETEENIKRFKTWIHSRRKELQLNTVKRLSRSVADVFMSEGFRERDYQEFIKHYKPEAEKHWKIACDIIKNFFREAVTESVMRSDLDPHIGVLHRRHNFGLVLDICYILEPEIDLQGIQFFKCNKKSLFLTKEEHGEVVSKDGMKDIVHRFENRRKELHDVVERILGELFCLMRELRL